MAETRFGAVRRFNFERHRILLKELESLMLRQNASPMATGPTASFAVVLMPKSNARNRRVASSHMPAGSETCEALTSEQMAQCPDENQTSPASRSLGRHPRGRTRVGAVRRATFRRTSNPLETTSNLTCFARIPLRWSQHRRHPLRSYW